MNDGDKTRSQLVQELNDLRHQLANRASAKDHELEHIHSVLQALNSTLDLDEVVERVMGALTDIFNFNQISIYLFNAGKNVLEVTNWYGEQANDESMEKFRRFPLSIDCDDIYFVKCFLDSEPKIVTDITPDTLKLYSEPDRKMFGWNPHRAIGIFPLEVQDKVIGVINFVHTEEPFDIHREDVVRIQRYVASVATAINNAYLVRKTRYALAKSQEKEREIAHINQVILTTNATLNFDEVFEAISRGLSDIFRFEAVGIQLVDEGGLLNIYNVYGGFVTESLLAQWRNVRITTNQQDSVSSHVFETGKPFYLSRLERDDLMFSIDRQIYDIIPFTAFLAFPLNVQDMRVGVISFFRTEGQFQLGSPDLERVQRYVAAVSTAIHNARNYEKLKSRNVH